MKFKHNHKEFFQKLGENEKNICFLSGEKSIIAFNPQATFAYKISQKENKFEEFANEQSKLGRIIIGYFSYDFGYKVHNIKPKAKDDLKLADIKFFAFENWIEDEIIHHKNPIYIDQIEKINKRPKVKTQNEKSKNFTIETPKEKYLDSYRKIKKYIKEGDIYQINLTHRLKAETKLSGREVFKRVTEKNNVEFLAYIQSDECEILSASPERFIQIQKRNIKTTPIKGTKPRGKTKSEDEKQKKELIESEKEKAELNMITDLLRNDIGKCSKIGTVRVTKKREIKECPNVWHTYSEITAEISPGISNVEALLSMMPGGSITGCPKKRAMEIIDELEPTRRSIYTGNIGYIKPNQDLDFNIAIRTIIKKDNNLYLQVGGGIVLDSTEKAEFQETLDKASSFMNIL